MLDLIGKPFSAHHFNHFVNLLLAPFDETSEPGVLTGPVKTLNDTVNDRVQSMGLRSVTIISCVCTLYVTTCAPLWHSLDLRV